MGEAAVVKADILENGLGLSSPLWARITDSTAGTTRVCSYDRAGQGWSDDAPAPQDSTAVTRDLHTLLEAIAANPRQRLSELPLMREGASIILTGSIASAKVLENHAVYAGTKAAISAFARSWALEQQFEPQMDAGERERKVKGWDEAVRRTLTV